jgi:putative heme-binding domain-containing protein
LGSSPDLAKALLLLQDDADAKTRFQLLCTLGSVNTPGALEVRNKLLFRDINDQWVQVAALSGSSSQTASLLNVVLDSFQQESLAYASLVQRLSAMTGANEKPAIIHQLIQKATLPGSEQQSAWQAPLLEGLAQGFKARNTHASISNGDEEVLVKTFFENSSGKIRDAAFDMLKVTGIKNTALQNKAIARAVSIASDQRQAENKRVEAISFIELGGSASHVALMEQLISPHEQSNIQVAALRTLSVIPGNAVSEYLLKQWSNLTPEIQDAAMNTFLVNEDRIALLLDAIEASKVQPASVGWHRSVRLMAQSNLALREKARKLLTKSDEEREKVNKEYQQALSLKGDPEKGKNVYIQNCSSCHQIRGEMGVSFGPDLGTIHNWSAEAIMANILAPNLSISSGYDLWAVELKNGESFQGVISSETATAITLKNAGRETRTINRTDIKSLKAQNMSSMPTGLEKQINQQQMADLLAYLRQNK